MNVNAVTVNVCQSVGPGLVCSSVPQTSIVVQKNDSKHTTAPVDMLLHYETPDPDIC